MLAFSKTNEVDLLAIWSQTTIRALQVEQYSKRPGARVVGFGGGAKKVLGVRLRSRDHTSLECLSFLVNILLQILCYPPLVWILPSNLEVKTKKIKKVFIAKS